MIEGPAAVSPGGEASSSLLVERVVEEHGPRIIATLIGVCGGDFQLAEDAFQEALIVALERWPREGVPRRPDAWIITAARHKAIDALRRDQTLARKREQLAALMAVATDDEEEGGGAGLQDDRLRLIFTCCHPSLAPEAQVALTLHTVAGLKTPEIAHAFLVPLETMAKRLVRARTKIRDARIPYRIPEEHELPDRLSGVLSVLYLVFNEGYLSSGNDALMRTELCDEAIRLARLLVALMPDEPEAIGLLALMLITDARRKARVDASGDLLTLDEQDRALWDAARIAEGTTLVERCARLRRPGPYQLQAAIAALHVEAPRPEETDWRQIAFLYDRLLYFENTPVVELNRAAAVAMAFSLEVGLRMMDDLETSNALPDYHVLPGARADLLRRAGRFVEAREAYQKAIALCANAAETRYFQRRLREVSET